MNSLIPNMKYERLKRIVSHGQAAIPPLLWHLLVGKVELLNTSCVCGIIVAVGSSPTTRTHDIFLRFLPEKH